MPDPYVFDKTGRPQSMAWLRQRYGNVEIRPPASPLSLPPPLPPRERVGVRVRAGGGGAPLPCSDGGGAGGGGYWRVHTFQEREGPTALVVTVIDERGHPVDRCPVAFYWPDAPLDPDARGLGRCVHGNTNGEGHIGFGMGGGAYYNPAHAAGPHAVWIYGIDYTELVTGLGMLAGTNHTHLDVTFAWQEPAPTPPPNPPPDPDPEPTTVWDAILDRLDRIIVLLEGLTP